MYHWGGKSFLWCFCVFALCMRLCTVLPLFMHVELMLCAGVLSPRTGRCFAFYFCFLALDEWCVCACLCERACVCAWQQSDSRQDESPTSDNSNGDVSRITEPVVLTVIQTNETTPQCRLCAREKRDIHKRQCIRSASWCRWFHLQDHSAFWWSYLEREAV